MIEPASLGKTAQSELISTAYHEAGHVVAAWLQHFAPQRVTIVAVGETLGEATHTRPRLGRLDYVDITPRRRERVERAIIVCLAGQIAEERYSKTDCTFGAMSDSSTALNLASYVTGSVVEAEAYLAWLHIRTQLCVDNGWPMIKRIADALLEHHTLKRRKLVDLLARPFSVTKGDKCL